MTVLVDTSAWIEYLRETGSTAHGAARDIALGRVGGSTCAPVMMEVFAGARNDEHAESLQWLFGRSRKVHTDFAHYEEAAAIHRHCRRNGITVRSLVDCVIAAVALREDHEVLHADRDFAAIASVLPLRIHPASAA